MTGNKLIRKIFKLKELKVRFFTIKYHKGEIHIFVKPHKNGCHCPECNRRCPIVCILPQERIWRDVTFGGWIIFFHYHPKEILCPTHGRIQEEIPWSALYSRVTYRFEFQFLIYCQIMCQKAAARLLRIAKSTLSDLLHSCIERLRKGHRIRGLKCMGVDEISYRKGKKYATIVYDLEKSKVVWVGKGKGKESLNSFFNDALSDFQKAQIQKASCDMSRAYIESIKDNCPDVTIVLDKFHIAKALNDAVDEVRKEKWRQLSCDERKVFKGLRWILYKHSSTRTKDENQFIYQLEKNNRAIYRASRLKDEFEHFWTYNSFWGAGRFLKNWTRAALKSRLTPLKDFARMIRNHFKNIISYAESKITNAISEGINRIIKIVKNRASGFYNLKSFSDLIFLTVGDLNLPEQILPKYRTF